MNRKLFLLATALFVLSCSTLFPQSTLPPPTESLPDPESTFAANTSTELIGFTQVRLHPKDGELSEMLATEAEKATKEGLLPIVEFDADWCPPCQAISKYLDAENALMLNAYDGTYIIKLDVDEWGWEDGKIGDFTVEAIPVYFKLDGQGKPTGEMIDGGAWNEDIPENIAPVMDDFFHGG